MIRRGIAPLIILIAIAVAAIGGGAAVHTLAKGPPTPEQVSALKAVGAAADPYTLGLASVAVTAIVAAWRQRNRATVAETAAGEYHASDPTLGESPKVSPASWMVAQKAAKRNARKLATASA